MKRKNEPRKFKDYSDFIPQENQSFVTDSFSLISPQEDDILEELQCLGGYIEASKEYQLGELQ
jgi:hypothetical protein